MKTGFWLSLLGPGTRSLSRQTSDRAVTPAQVTGFPGTPLCHAAKIETKAAIFFPTGGKKSRGKFVETFLRLKSYPIALEEIVSERMKSPSSLFL